MSDENLEVVRGIYDAWSQGDFSSVDWADTQVEFRSPEFMATKTHHGIETMAREWASWLHTFEGFTSTSLEYFDAGDQVVTFNRFSGEGKSSGLPLSEIPGAARFRLRDRKVVELQIYTDRKQALRDAGLKG